MHATTIYFRFAYMQGAVVQQQRWSHSVSISRDRNASKREGERECVISWRLKTTVSYRFDHTLLVVSTNTTAILCSRIHFFYSIVGTTHTVICVNACWCITTTQKYCWRSFVRTCCRRYRLAVPHRQLADDLTVPIVRFCDSRTCVLRSDVISQCIAMFYS